MVLSGSLLWKPGFWLILFVCYALFEGMLLLGRYVQKKGILIGAQVVITGALLLLFHEIPVVYPENVPEEEVSYFTSIGIIAALALVMYVGLVLLSRVSAVICTMIIATDIIIVFRCVNGIQTKKAAIAAALALTLLELSRGIGFLEERFGNGNSRLGCFDKGVGTERYRWLIFFMVLEALVLGVPVNEEPIDWSFVYKIGYRVRDGFETFVEDTGYFFSGIGDGAMYQSGYSGFGAVPDAINGSSREELYITTDGTKDSLYLAGHIEGDDEDISDEMKGERFLDFLYALYSHDVGREEAKCFGRVMKLTAEFGYLRTKDVIRPENTLLIDSVKKDAVDIEGTQFVKTHKKGDSYDIVYLNVDYGSRYLEKIMRNPIEAAVPSYDEMEDYCGKLFDYQLSRTVSEIGYRKWSGKKKSIEKNTELAIYLEPGDMATTRMKELAEEITKGAQNDYDKCRLIEKYLRQYKYSTHPGKTVDNGSNYIDSFLFETGEGYCVHYASAMVALLRLSGVPARYVEGYCYTFPSIKHDRFVVTGDRAHAWVEAYIEGTGWVPFEPTAARRTSIESSWNYTIPEEEETAEIEIEADAEQFVPDIPDNAAGYLSDEAMDEEENETKKHTIDLLVLGKLLVTIFIGLLIYAILMWGAIVLVRVIKYKRAPMALKLEKNVKDILWYMGREFPGTGEKARVLEDYVLALPEGEAVNGERLEITDLKALSDYVFSVYYRQRFAGRSANGAEVRDSEYLRKHLRRRYIKQMLPFRIMYSLHSFR